MQAVFTYHLTEDSLSTQKLNPPNNNNKIGNATFIPLLLPPNYQGLT